MPLTPYPLRTSPFHGGKRWGRHPRVGRRRRVEWPEYALAGQHSERLTLTPELKHSNAAWVEEFTWFVRAEGDPPLVQEAAARFVTRKPMDFKPPER
jgi:hypothetical protein